MRKVARAARTESELEGDLLRGPLAEELQEAKARAAGVQRLSRPVSPPPAEPPGPLTGADVRGAEAAHLALVATLVAAEGRGGRGVEVLWVRSSASHVAWCERRHLSGPEREVIRVARVEGGEVREQWRFG